MLKIAKFASSVVVPRKGCSLVKFQLLTTTDFAKSKVQCKVM